MKNLNDVLSIRQFTLDDAQFVLELVNSEGWLRFIGDKHIYDLEAARNYIRNGPLHDYQSNGLGLKVVEYDESTNFSKIPVGVCGLLLRPFLNSPDIGYALLPHYEGRGYIRWAVNITLGQLHSKHTFSEVYALITPGNERSVRVIDKFGFEVEGSRILNGRQTLIYKKML